MSNRRHFGNVRKLPSGHWQASCWHEGQRHTLPVTYKTKADALACLATVETDLRRGAWIDPDAGKVKLEELAKEWLKSNPRKRESSRARDDSILRSHLLPVLGPRAIASITRHDVQALVDAWGAEQAPSTVRRQYSCLRALFAYAEATDKLTRSPCRGIRLPRGRLVDRPTLGADELERLAEVLDEDQSPMMWAGAVLGLRWAEAAGLTVDRLDILGGKLTIDRQLARSGQLEPPKSSAGVRTLACPTCLLDELAALLNRRGLTAADGDKLVFVSPDGAPLHYTNWRRRTWVPGCEEAGLAGLRFHDLRSVAATALVASGVDVKTAQTRLGHSSSRMTLDLHARATGKADQIAADKVGTYLRPSRTLRARPSGEKDEAGR
ncbi:MAG: tyrosine-type recombinase/integrase [Acidimicrobiales bacterium]